MSEALDKLRRNVMREVMKYAQVMTTPERFVYGQTPIPPSGKTVGSEEYLLAVQAVLDGWWTEGHFTDEFETMVKEKIGVRHATMVNSGSSANFLALLALMQHDTPGQPLRQGDVVLTAAAGFPTTINPIIQLGLTPLFIDVNPETLVPDVNEIANAIHRNDAQAVFLAHTLGNPWGVLELKKYFPDVWFIEDNCDAFGSEFILDYGEWDDEHNLHGRKLKMTGSVGHLSTLSFYPAHHLTTGEGGMVLTDNPRLHKIIRSLRDWGRDCWCPTGHDNTCGKRFDGKHGDLPENYDHKYVYSRLGFNMKSTDMNAAIGVAQMHNFEGHRLMRSSNHRRLSEAVIACDKGDNLYLPTRTPDTFPSWFGLVIGVRDTAPFTRTDIVAHLNEKKVGTRMVFAGNYLYQPAIPNCIDAGFLRRLGFARDDFDDFMPGSRRVMNEMFWIGCWPGLSKGMMGYIDDVFYEYLPQK